MKNRQVLNKLTLVVAAVFILGLFSGIAVAQNPKEQYEKEKEKIQNEKERYGQAKKEFDDAKEQFKSARLKFKSAKDKLSRDELINKTKAYLEKTIDYMVVYLNNQKSRINDENQGIFSFDVSGNIDTHIAQLESIRTEIQTINTSEDLVKSAREIEDIAIKVGLETRYYAGILVNHRTDLYFEKADNVSARIDAEIQKLIGQGMETSKLEKEFLDFKNLVNEAKDNHEKSLELFANHTGFDSNGLVTDNKEARTFLGNANDIQKDTLKKLKAAANKLRDIFMEGKKFTAKKAAISGTGKLVANGTGRALIEGNVTVTLSGNSTLIVSSNAIVTTDGTKEVLGNGNIKYQKFSSATISGDNIRIEITGNDISLTAEGTGSAILKGNGTYRTEKDFAASGEWNKED